MTDAMLSRYVAIMMAGTSSQNFMKIAANDIDMIPAKRTTTVFAISTPCGFTNAGSNLVLHYFCIDIERKSHYVSQRRRFCFYHRFLCNVRSEILGSHDE